MTSLRSTSPTAESTVHYNRYMREQGTRWCSGLAHMGPHINPGSRHVVTGEPTLVTCQRCIKEMAK